MEGIETHNTETIDLFGFQGAFKRTSKFVQKIQRTYFTFRINKFYKLIPHVIVAFARTNFLAFCLQTIAKYKSQLDFRPHEK